jgi:hypothetical protein
MSGDRLPVSQFLLLTAYAGGMSAGQLLFKMAANSYGTADVGGVGRLLALCYNLYFLSAIRGVSISAYTFVCRFAVWRNDFAAPDYRSALNTRRSVFRIGLMEL